MRTKPLTPLHGAEIGLWQRSHDYLALTKPRVMVMTLVVTSLGFYMGAREALNGFGLLHVNLGMALASGGALALNQYMERQHDANMHRTRCRPLPDGRLQPAHALTFGLMLSLAGTIYLSLMVGPLAGVVTLVTTSSYLFLYTPLKRITHLCCMVGALPGALPLVVGWVAARGQLDPELGGLFAIFFLWQLPHAWAIAWLHQHDYDRAGFRLLPPAGPDDRRIRSYIVLGCLALLAVSALPMFVGLTGFISCMVIFGLALMLLLFGVAAAIVRTPTAIQYLVWASLVYLPLACVVIAFDKAPGHSAPPPAQNAPRAWRAQSARGGQGCERISLGLDKGLCESGRGPAWPFRVQMH